MKRWVIGAVAGSAGLMVAVAAVAALALGGAESPAPESSDELAAWSAEAMAGYAAVEDGARADRQPTTTTAPPTTVPTTVPPSPTTAPTRSGGDSGTSEADPDLLANTPPPPPSGTDPFAGCPHRWQVDHNGQLVDTGCGSEPGPIVTPPIIITPHP